MERFVLKGKLLLDGTGRPPIENGVVLIEGNRIVAAGEEKNVIPPANVKVIDCGAQVLIPGLIDCHNHLAMDPTLENWPARLNDSDAEQALRATVHMGIDLKAGVTTARCLGDKNFLDVACKRAVASGQLVGPRLIVATRGIRATHGHGFVGYPFDGPDQIRRAVRENLKAGADFIKLFITGTVRQGREIQSYLSREEISVAVQEAHRANVCVTAHCIGGIGLEECLAAGVEAIEHGYFLSDREIDLLLKAGRWLVLTPSPYFSEERVRTLPLEIADAFRRGREEVAERMSAIIKGGIKFAVGTDGRHGGLAQEIEYLVRLGASEKEALRAATHHAAVVCGLEGIIGTIEPGKMADIVGLMGNPLDDIRNLKKVGTVISRGKLLYSGVNE